MADDRGPQLTAVQVLFMCLSWLCVSLRIYVRTMLTKFWGWDDVILVIALLLFTAFAACSAVSVHYGTGRHIQDIPPEDVTAGLYYWWICEVLFAPTTLLIRVSLTILLLRICEKPIHRFWTYMSLLGITLSTVSYFFVVIFQCAPVSYFWRRHQEGVTGHCIDDRPFLILCITFSVGSFSADWVFGLLPVAVLWDLQMRTRVKISVGLLLSLGLVAGIANLIRIQYLKNLNNTADFLHATVDTSIWTIVEAGLGLTAAGAATIRPLLRRLLDRPSRPDEFSTQSRPWTSWTKSGTNLPSRNPFVPNTEVISDTIVMTNKTSPLPEGGRGETSITVLRTVDVITGDPESDDARSERGTVKMQHSREELILEEPTWEEPTWG